MNIALLDAETVSTMLGCTELTVQQSAVSGDLPGVKFGRGWLFPVDALAARLTEKALSEAAARRAAVDAGRTHTATTAISVRKGRALPALVDMGSPQ